MRMRRRLEHDAAMTQKLTYNKVIEPWIDCGNGEGTLELPQQIQKSTCDAENYILQQMEKNYKLFTLDNFCKRLNILCT